MRAGDGDPSVHCDGCDGPWNKTMNKSKHLTICGEITLPVETRMLVPCTVGTNLQAIRPKYHLPPYRHWIRVGGIQMRQVASPDTPRFRMYRFLGVRLFLIPVYIKEEELLRVGS